MKKFITTLIFTAVILVAAAQNSLHTSSGVTISAPLGIERNDALSQQMGMDVFVSSDQMTMIGVGREPIGNETPESILRQAAKGLGIAYSAPQEIDLDGGKALYVSNGPVTIAAYPVPGTSDVVVVMLAGQLDTAAAVSFLGTLEVKP